MSIHLRVARPVSDLARASRLYRTGLGLREVGSFADHQGFDGVMLGFAEAEYHLEFTQCRAHPVAPSPTAEDLLVFYLPDEAAWNARCSAMIAAGFTEAEPLNPYWAERGRTFIDPDGYRVVIQQATWKNPP